MPTDTARHYAEKVRATLKLIADADERNLEALTSREFDTNEYKVAAREARGLRAALLLHAANLAEAVLAERTSTDGACVTGVDPVSGFDTSNSTVSMRCGAEFAGHVCGRVPGHDPAIKHCDILTGQRW